MYLKQLKLTAILGLLPFSLWASDLHINHIAAYSKDCKLATKKVQQALDQVSKGAGGTLTIGPGTYLITTITIGSNTQLVLQNGAILKADTNISNYPKSQAGHNKDLLGYTLIKVENAHHVVITGGGTIDGSGPGFWKDTRPSAYHFWQEKELRVSPLVDIKQSHHVTIQRVTLASSPGWTLHLKASDDIVVDQLEIKNDLYGPNTDGIDINGCHRVVVSNCNIVAGDDGIVCKTTEDVHRTCEDVLVTNCIVSTNCAALKLGTESHYDFKRIQFNNCTVPRSTRIMEVTICDGGIAEQITYNNIVGQTNAGWTFGRPLVVNLNQRNRGSKLGGIKSLAFNNCMLRSDGRVMIGAAPPLRMGTVLVSNLVHELVMIDPPRPNAIKAEGDRTYGKDLPEMRDSEATIVAQNIEKLILRDITVVPPTYPVADDWLLLKSPWGSINPPHYQDLQAVKFGKTQPEMKALWTKDIGTLVADHALLEQVIKKP